MFTVRVPATKIANPLFAFAFSVIANPLADKTGAALKDKPPAIAKLSSNEMELKVIKPPPAPLIADALEEFIANSLKDNVPDDPCPIAELTPVLNDEFIILPEEVPPVVIVFLKEEP